MKPFRSHFIRAGFDALYFSGAYHMLRPLLGGVGVILMLHHVRPASRDTFQPNQHLEITPDFLRDTLAHVRELGLDIVTLDEMHRRLKERDFSRRFVCFTFDDGYRDNRDFALPVMRDYGAPLAVYAASEFADGTGQLWWITLERVIAKADSIEVPIDGGIKLDTSTPAGKEAAYDRLHPWLRNLPTDRDIFDVIDGLCAQHGLANEAACRELCMPWEELRSFSEDPLVTIGAHTVTHCTLTKTSETKAAYEMATSRASIQDMLQKQVLHFAYPYGDKNAARTREFGIAGTLGFKTAVTTRPGMLFAESADYMMALPRISLNGHYQDKRFISVLTSGAATAMWNGFRRIDAA